VIENVEGQRGAYARVLDEMQEAGYAGTELGDWGFMPTDPRVLRRELESRKLKLLASWVTVHLHDSARLPANEADVLRTARQLAEVGGPDNLVVLGNDPYTDPLRTLAAGRILPDHGMSEAQWADVHRWRKPPGAHREARDRAPHRLPPPHRHLGGGRRRRRPVSLP